MISGAGVLTVSVRTMVARSTRRRSPSTCRSRRPGCPSSARSASGWPPILGLAGWSTAVGPAAIDLDGPVIRPLVRAAFATGAGWQAEVGLGFDEKAPTDVDHRELVARWRQANGLTVLATHRTGAATVEEDTTPEGVATAAIDAVLDLVGGWVLGVADVKAQLKQTFGTKTVGKVLEGSILEPGRARRSPRLPGRAHRLARQAADDGEQARRRGAVDDRR